MQPFLSSPPDAAKEANQVKNPKDKALLRQLRESLESFMSVFPSREESVGQKRGKKGGHSTWGGKGGEDGVRGGLRDPNRTKHT